MELPCDTALELARLAGLVLTEPDLDAALTRVTQVAVAVVGSCDGASLTMRRTRVPDTPAADGAWARALDELQFREQEGPAWTACARDRWAAGGSRGPRGAGSDGLLLLARPGRAHARGR